MAADGRVLRRVPCQLLLKNRRVSEIPLPTLCYCVRIKQTLLSALGNCLFLMHGTAQARLLPLHERATQRAPLLPLPRSCGRRSRLLPLPPCRPCRPGLPLPPPPASSDVHALGDARHEAGLDRRHGARRAALLAAQVHEARRAVLVQQRVDRLAAGAQHVPAVHACGTRGRRGRATSGMHAEK